MKKTRNLGLVAIMALVLTALVGVASASASGFVGQKYPSYLRGTGIGTAQLNTVVENAKCQTPTLEAELSTGFETMVASIGDTTCGVSQPLKSNGCKFILHPGSAAGGKFDGTFDIGPSGCGPITLVNAGCETRIGAQTGLKGNYYNEGSGANAAVGFEAQANNSLKYTIVGAGCGAGSYSSGTFTGAWNLKNFSNPARTTQQGVRLSETYVDLYVAGKKSEEKINQPKFEAGKYPVKILGNQPSATQALKFATSEGNAKCGSVDLLGETSSSTTELALSAENSGCIFNGVAITVAMNSCHYGTGVANAGPPYIGSLSLVCSNPGDGIRIDRAGCSTTFPAQTLGALTYENVGIPKYGNGVHILTTVTGEGLTYSSVGGSCTSPGTRSDGKLSGQLDLIGLAAAF